MATHDSVRVARVSDTCNIELVAGLYRSLLLDELLNDCKYMSLPCVINNLAMIRKTGFTATTVRHEH